MSEIDTHIALPETVLSGADDFGEIRKDIAQRLFMDPSYSIFDAMYEMSCATERYIDDIAVQHPPHVLWVGGSLGRREMLPNSDIDLFVVYDDEDYSPSKINVAGVDKFEIGHIHKSRLNDLLEHSFVDANRFIDGRSVGAVPADDVERMIIEVNTPDRQLANNISEYFYYRYFDFPEKTTSMGPNLKYSTGSSRDTIFYNMISRMGSGSFPAARGLQPELSEVLAYSQQRYGIRPPVQAINMMFIAKNAAISLFDATGDPRSKYVSSFSLELIYNYCEDKFTALGYGNSRDFISSYMAARREIELSVDTLFVSALNEHPAGRQLRDISLLNKIDLPEACIAEIDDLSSDCPQSLIAFSAWMAVRNGASARNIENMTMHMKEYPINRVWGGLMAMACSPNASDNTLSALADWLYDHEKGAYLTKLITRNPSASERTREKALGYYADKEIIL